MLRRKKYVLIHIRIRTNTLTEQEGQNFKIILWLRSGYNVGNLKGPGRRGVMSWKPWI